MRRVVRVGIAGAIPKGERHDEEVHGVVTNNDAVLELRVCRRACHAQAHVPNDDATMVFNMYFVSGCCVIFNFPAVFARA